MLETVIIIGILVAVGIISKVMDKQPVPVKRASYIPVGMEEDGTIICAKKIDIWG